jgi:hypothetical protein
LIVDYICDWARDVYRPAILTALRLLSSPGNADVRTAFTDTDIFSSGDNYLSRRDDDIEDGNDSPYDAAAAFRALDSPKGVVRHAAFIESKFRALIVTRDNIQTLLDSIQQNVLQTFTRQILAQAHLRNTPLTAKPISITNSPFFTLLNFTYYFNAWWEQVRKLSIVAVAEDAFELLVAASGLKVGKGKARVPSMSHINNKQVMSMISDLKGCSAHQNLLAAITRVSVCIADFPPGYPLGNWDNPSLQKCDDGNVWELVEHAYMFFKKGCLEPNEPFLRVSRNKYIQTIDHKRR